MRTESIQNQKGECRHTYHRTYAMPELLGQPLVSTVPAHQTEIVGTTGAHDLEAQDMEAEVAMEGGGMIALVEACHAQDPACRWA